MHDSDLVFETNVLSAAIRRYRSRSSSMVGQFVCRSAFLPEMASWYRERTRYARKPLWLLNCNVGDAAAGIYFRVPISVTLVVALVTYLDHCRGAWKRRYNRCRLVRRGSAKRVTGNANRSSANRISVPCAISVRAVVVPILICVVLPVLLILIDRVLPIPLVLTRGILPILLVLSRSVLQVLLIRVSRLLILANRVLSILLVLTRTVLQVLLISASRLLILAN